MRGTGGHDVARPAASLLTKRKTEHARRNRRDAMTVPRLLCLIVVVGVTMAVQAPTSFISLPPDKVLGSSHSIVEGKRGIGNRDGC